MNKTMKITTIIFCVIFLTGCWDKVEIEERTFVYGIAIDLAENFTEKNKEIRLIQQFVIPENISTTGSNGGEGKPYQLLEGTGKTIFEINREMMREENLKTDVTHLKIVLFSEEMAKEPMLYEEMLDVFLRKKDMRRGIKTAIASGEAKEFLKVAPENEKIPAEYINGLLDNPQKFEVLDLVVIGDLQEKLFNQESFPLPLLNIKEVDGDKLIDYEGIAVFNGRKHKVVGNIKGDAAKGLSFILGMKNTGTLNVENKGKTSTFVITDLKSKITLENKDIHNMEFTINIDIETELAEQFGTEDLSKKSVIDQFEKSLEEKAELKMKEAINKLQKELETDILRVGNYLSHYHPKIWKKVKDDWEQGENYFVKSKIVPKVKATFVKPGSINRTASDGEE